MICVVALGSAGTLRADDPFPRTRDYDLQNVRVHLRFDTDNKKVIGEVTHSISILRPNVSELKFDSVELTIESVTLDGKAAKYETTADHLIVKLPQAAHPGEHMEVSIHYWGTPTKGLYWVLPDKDYPERPREIWSQGESEDTLLYSHLRLSQRPDDFRDARDRTRQLDHDFERQACRGEDRSRRHEDVGLEAGGAAFDLLDFGGGRRICREEGHVAWDAGGIRRAERTGIED